MNIVQLIIGFLLGIISSMIATILLNKNRAAKENRIYKHLAGIWLERIDGQDDRRFSIAYFRFEKSDRKYHYNGINFKNDGTIYYRWRSEKIFKDTDTERILYIYSVSDNGVIYTLKEGFGVSYFDYVRNECNFTHGYFLDADLKDEPRNIRFIKASNLAKKYSYDLSDKSERGLGKFIKRIAEIEEQTGKPCF